MRPEDGLDQLLLRLVQNEKSDVVHLAYTPTFEAACSALGEAPSIEDKHRIWERILQIGSALGTPAAPPPEHRAPVIAFVPTVPLPEQTPEPALTSSGFQESLFDGHPSPSPRSIPLDLQRIARDVVDPIAPPQPISVELTRAKRDLDAKRHRLLAEIADSHFGTIEQRVAYLLQRFPETRESYIALSIRYWKRFQSDILERWPTLELEVLFELEKIESINRSKRIIQNDLKLFRGSEDTAQYKLLFQEELHKYLAAHRGVVPEIRFYLDETGNEADKPFTGVAGVCVINWKQYEKHAEALSEWRRQQAWPEPIHFSEVGGDRLDRAVKLLGQLQKRRAGLLFLGYAMSSRASTREEMYTLFVHLVIDSLHQLIKLGCLQEPRTVRIIKEAEPGFDGICLPKMSKQLAELADMEFSGRVNVEPVETMTKGHHVLLECADLIAGGMQRRALQKGRNPKDRLAEAVVNVTGFEDANDDGAVFKIHR